jgi:hypothetical protein
MLLAFATAATFAVQGGTPVANGFDLARPATREIAREQASQAPVAPRHLDVRTFAVDAPEFELPLADNGLTLLVGAMGGKQEKTFAGLPKLAHVALAVSF